MTAGWSARTARWLGCVVSAGMVHAGAAGVPETVELAPYAVTAFRIAEDPALLAADVTVFNRAAVRESASATLPEFLRTVGGVSVTSFTGGASGAAVDFRGFGENRSSRVLVLVDGHPLNRPDMAAPAWQEIPLSQVERVELLEGSQTARFGEYAVGGVINIITSLGDESEPVRRVEGVAGSDGTWGLRLYGKAPLEAGAISLTLSHHETDGWRENAASSVSAVRVNLARSLGERISIRAGLSRSEEASELPGPLTARRFAEDPRQSIYQEFGQESVYGHEGSGWRAHAVVRGDVDGTRSWRLRAGWSSRSERSDIGPGNHTDPNLRLLSLHGEYRGRLHDWEWTLGGSLASDDLKLVPYATVEREIQRGRADLERSTTSLFLKADRSWASGWTASAALRATAFRIDAALEDSQGIYGGSYARDRRDESWALQLGLRRQWSSGLGTWIRYDRLHRFPSTDEMASYRGFPLSRPFNDQLGPETGHAFEAGFGWQAERWEVRATGFTQTLDGEITFDYVANLNVNRDAVRRRGVDAEITWRGGPLEWTSGILWLDAAVLRGRYTGSAVSLVPRWRAWSQLRVDGPGALEGELRWRGEGSAPEGNDAANERPRMDGHTVWDAVLRWRWNEWTQLSLHVDNLFDARYAGIQYNGLRYPANGRQWKIRLAREF